uniref:(California timema) hypothetical protein n=1 Tax=Timema californicum TaxID=61474 RepID=A0A7R9JHG0_TIMCA|nr:unnamed protein product [Timema californicum]
MGDRGGCSCGCSKVGYVDSYKRQDLNYLLICDHGPFLLRWSALLSCSKTTPQDDQVVLTDDILRNSSRPISELFHDYCGDDYSGPTGPEALKRCGPSFPPLLACLTFRTPGGKRSYRDTVLLACLTFRTPGGKRSYRVTVLLACITFRTPGGMITRGCGIRGYCDNAVEGTYCDVCFKDGCNGSFKI